MALAVEPGSWRGAGVCSFPDMSQVRGGSRENMSSWQEAGLEDLGEDLFVSLAELIDVIKKLPSGMAKGVD